MSKKAIKVFTIVGILSVLFRLGGVLLADYFTMYRIASFIDITGQILFLILFFFIAKDLKENYDKPVRIIYLFIFSSLTMTLINVTNILSGSLLLFVRFMFLTIITLFGLYLFKTVYRLFAIIFLISILVTYLSYLAINEFLGDKSYNYWIFLSAIPALYPLVLIYIVRTRNNFLSEDEINSIGRDIGDEY